MWHRNMIFYYKLEALNVPLSVVYPNQPPRNFIQSKLIWCLRSEDAGEKRNLSRVVSINGSFYSLGLPHYFTHKEERASEKRLTASHFKGFEVIQRVHIQSRPSQKTNPRGALEP